MRFLIAPSAVVDLDSLVRAGEAVHAAGLDGVYLARTAALPSPLVAAAALSARVPHLRLAVEVEVGEEHPMEIAEEAAVVDVASGGRLILVATPAPDREARFGEVLDLLRTAFAPVPFRFEGPTWRVPANLPQNEFNLEVRARLTPSPVQPRLEVWGAGGGRDEALRRGLGYVAGADDDLGALGTAWAGAAALASVGAPRVRRDTYDGDAAALVARLRAGREAFGQGWAVVGADATAAVEISRRVRPRVQSDRLPEGLEAHWDATL
jgi:alkanesulfonate monooxygenase SsuD/methylene tetrahydromethanopterin reductase-like flavin-dependent oxidoreductase (luciferase family)